MKVLWFTNTPSLYDQGKHYYHGGGWIESLEELLSHDKSIDLGISFFHNSDSEKIIKNQTTYYPIYREKGRKNPFTTIYNNWRFKIDDQKQIDQLIKVVNDFQPDIIHIFGTEGVFGLIQNYTSIPIVIHLQGLINPYLNVYLPPGFSKKDYLFNINYLIDNLLGRSPIFGLKKFEKQATREALILSNAKHVMGRTDWDKTISQFFNRNVNYYHVDEVLRPIFYESGQKLENNDDVITILCTLSPTNYKGIDLVLKTAKLLMENSFTKFEWKIIGINENDKLLKHFEKKLNIFHSVVNIKCFGRNNPIELKNQLLGADIFVHPSYIDNSPNSVCEAQILGIPVISCNVGGVSSLIENNKTGKLIPANGLYELASLIMNFDSNKSDYKSMAFNGQNLASKRHDSVKIKSQLLSSYKKIINY